MVHVRPLCFNFLSLSWKQLYLFCFTSENFKNLQRCCKAPVVHSPLLLRLIVSVMFAMFVQYGHFHIPPNTNAYLTKVFIISLVIFRVFGGARSNTIEIGS